jgi:hypothetical protein
MSSQVVKFEIEKETKNSVRYKDLTRMANSLNGIL